MESNWVVLILDQVKKIRKPLAFMLVLCAFSLRFTPWAHAIDGALLALGLLLLPPFFEMHKNVVASAPSTVFDTFDSAKTVLAEEIERLSDSPEPHTLRYLGLAAVNWPYIESCLNCLLKQSSVPALTIELVMVDPKWQGIDDLNPAWRHQVVATSEWVQNFLIINKTKIEVCKWSIQVKYYQSIPQSWGVLVDNSTLFAGTAYWESGRMRGGQNPVEVFKSKDDRFGRIRIEEFNGWFQYFWLQQTKAGSTQQMVQPERRIGCVDEINGSCLSPG